MPEDIWRIGNHDKRSSLDETEAAPENRTKGDDTPIIMMLVLAGVAALSMLAGYFLKPNQSRNLIMTQPTTQSPANGEADCKKAGGEWDSKMNMCMEKKM